MRCGCDRVRALPAQAGHFPSEIGARLAFGIQTSSIHFTIVLIAVRLVSSGRYRSAADIGGAAKAPPSHALATTALASLICYLTAFLLFIGGLLGG